jgi:hypothetical protein
MRLDTVMAAAAAALRTLCFMTPTPTIMVLRYKTTRTIARRFHCLDVALALLAFRTKDEHASVNSLKNAPKTARYGDFNGSTRKMGPI